MASKTKLRLAAAAVAAAAIGLAASPAAAQSDMPAVIGATIGSMTGPKQADPECLAGRTVQPVEEVEAARAGSAAAMKAYWSLAGARPAGDISPLVFPRSKLAGWERPLAKEAPPPADDPLARAIAAGEAVAEPAEFFRGEETPTAVGLWLVRSPAGGELGYYRVWFRRAADAWKITAMAARREPLVRRPSRYCRMPGDVELYRDEIADLEAKRTRRAARSR